MKGFATLPRSAGHKHNSPAICHMANSRARSPEDRIDILIHRPLPPLVIHISQRNIFRGPDPRIADKKVQATEIIRGTIHKLVRASPRSNVCGIRHRCYTKTLMQTVCQRFGICPTAPVTNSDISAILGKQLRHGSADPPGATCNERPLSP
jgi:hypothetical protein